MNGHLFWGGLFINLFAREITFEGHMTKALSMYLRIVRNIEYVFFLYNIRYITIFPRSISEENL